MNFDQAFELGYLERVHGIHGELVLLIDADNPQAYSKLESVYLDIKGKLIPFFVQKLKPLRADTYLLKLEDINQEEDASDLVGCLVYLPLSVLPPLRDDQYYFHELIGMEVIDEIIGPVGVVRAVLETPQQFLLQFDHQGHEVLCPMHDDLLLAVDKLQRQIHLRLPDGLLDVYLS
ncbi:MAG: ribosome maturation factor RimM [Bacteroidia bacterium]